MDPRLVEALERLRTSVDRLTEAHKDTGAEISALLDLLDERIAAADIEGAPKENEP